jgi:hypothetical protein
MIHLNRNTSLLLIVIFFSTIVVACSSIQIISIYYKMPAKNNVLTGKKVFLEVRDSRPDKDILGPGAKEDFTNLSDSLSLSIAEGDEKGFKIGLFSVIPLMQEIFKERLMNLGMEVVTDKSQTGVPAVVIDLNTFKLDLIKGTVKRTWSASMAYTAGISYNGKVYKGNEINGHYESFKVIGRNGASNLMSSLVTDLANRVDVTALFKEAGIN